MIHILERKDQTMRFSTIPIDSNPRKMGGTVCIANTRMPVEDLFIHLMQGGTIHSFQKQYPGLELHQLKGVLKFAAHDLTKDCAAVERARSLATTREPRRDGGEVALA